jgi:hypothetical protein
MFQRLRIVERANIEAVKAAEARVRRFFLFNPDCRHSFSALLP